ncbi:hypothetical protein C8R44DRAFT_738725 [Mycena epipterygia]|nr:hypothetical protein C8R44DRAFT_738725 [Mycena epipterygia]
MYSTHFVPLSQLTDERATVFRHMLLQCVSFPEPPHDALTARYNFKHFGQTIFPNDVFTNEYILLPQFLAVKISVYVGSDVTGQPKETRYIRDVQVPSTFNRQRHRALAESTLAHAHEKSVTL